MEIEGVIKYFNGNELGLEGELTIIVTSETEVEGNLAQGQHVDVEVVVEADGSLTAVEVEVERHDGHGLPKLEIEGTITEKNGDTWTVAGYTVYLTGEAIWQVGGGSVTFTTHAEIEGDPQEGDTVEVKDLLGGPGLTLLALEIEVEDDGDEDEHREEHALVELNGVITGLSGDPADIDSLSGGTSKGRIWPGM